MSLPDPLLIVGNAVLDVLLEVGHYPREDEEMRALSRREDLGGNAANTARALAALGHETSLLATLAPDGDGVTLRRLLAEAGVDTRHLVTAPAGRTPVSTILLHGASRTIVHHRDLAELSAANFTALPLERYAWVHFEGRNVAGVAAMLDHLAARGFTGRISLEIEKDRPGLVALAARADLVLSCRAYATAKGHGEAPSLLAALGRHADRALVTCTWGEAGAWAREADGRLHHCPAFRPERVVDTVGAGDVFNAGLIHALLAGLTPANALKEAVELAGRKVGARGYKGPEGRPAG